MTKQNCIHCGKIIIKNIEKYLKDYPDENYIQCCYCNYHIPRFKIENLLQTKK